VNSNPPAGAPGYNPDEVSVVTLKDEGLTIAELYAEAKAQNPGGELDLYLEHRTTMAAAFGLGPIYGAQKVFTCTDKSGNDIPCSSTSYRRAAMRDKFGQIVEGTMGQAVVMDTATFQTRVTDDFATIPAAQFSVRKFVSAAVLLQIMYECRNIAGLQVDPGNLISDVLPGFTADDGAFLLSAEPSDAPSLEAYRRGHRDDAQVFSAQVVAGLQAALGLDWFQNAPAPSANADRATLGAGGTEKQHVTIQVGGSSLNFTLAKSTLSSYQKTTVAHALTERTGMRLDVYGLIGTHPGTVDSTDPDVAHINVALQLSTLLQQRNGLAYTGQKARVTIPGAKPAYGHGISLVIDMIETLGSKLYYHKANGSLLGFNATANAIPFATIMHDYAFAPLGMTNSKIHLGGGEAIVHMTSAPSIEAMSHLGASEHEAHYVMPDLVGLFGMLPGRLHSTSVDMTKFSYALHNRGIALNGQKVFATGVVRTMLSSFYSAPDELAQMTRVVDWDNLPLDNNINTLAQAVHPGAAYLNAPGAAIVPKDDMSALTTPYAWYACPSTGYHMKAGYGNQWSITQIDYGIYFHYEESFVPYDSNNHDTVDATVKKPIDGSFNDVMQLWVHHMFPYEAQDAQAALQ
jgi:hypothetical protein